MSRFISNKGNLLFTTAMCLVVAMIGFSIITLVTATKANAYKHTEDLYKRYSYESYARIAVNEVVNQLTLAEANIHYSPLQESLNTQLELQEALVSTFISETGYWKYSDLLPATLACTDINITLSIPNLNTILETNLDLQRTQVLMMPNIRLVVLIDRYTYCADLSGLKLIYTLSNNKVHCRYDTSDATVINTALFISNRR